MTDYFFELLGFLVVPVFGSMSVVSPVALPVFGSTGVTLILPPFSFGNSTATGGVVAVIGLRGLDPEGFVEPTFLPGLTDGILQGAAVISTSSISKIRVEFGPIGARLPISPYARSEGTNSLHFARTGMI